MDNKIIEVLKKVENDQELSKALSECRDPEKAFELVGGSDSGAALRSMSLNPLCRSYSKAAN